MMTKKSLAAAEEHPYSRRAAPSDEDSAALATVPTATGHKPMEWSENFQDLSSFCNFGSKMVDNNNMALQLGEQLDTPIITVNDEFDFGLRSSSRVCHDTLDDTDPWGDLNIQQQQQHNQPPTNPQSSSSNNNSNNVKQWESVTNWLCSSPNLIDIDYEPPPTFNNVVVADDEEKPNVVVEYRPSFAADSVKMREFIVEKDQRVNDDSLDKIAENKEQAIDIVELLKTANSNSNRMQYTHMFVAAGNNSNSSTAASNNSSKVLRNSLLLTKNRSSRDLSDSLSSIFKAEEPQVKDHHHHHQRQQQQTPSLVGGKSLSPGGKSLTPGGKILSRPQLVLHALPLSPPKENDVIEIGSASPTKNQLVFNVQPGEFVLPDIKMEPEDVCEEQGVAEEVPQLARSFKAPVKEVKKLRLDIRSANTLGAAAVLTPTTAVLGESLDTPDVLKPLLEGMDNPSFDLIEYCEADELAGITFPNGGGSSPLVVESRKTIPTSKNYGEKKEELYEVKEPLPTIKEEDITTDDSTLQSRAVAANSKISPRKKITPSRKRRRPNFENFESENSSDNYVDNEDEDETFHLPPKSKYGQSSKAKRQRTSSKTSTVSAGKRKISSSGIDSDQESIISLDRYRELRDRNNEASKRSRMNRKSREQEMKEMATGLENRNIYLKARANKLDKLVKTFREAMIKLVSARKD